MKNVTAYNRLPKRIQRAIEAEDVLEILKGPYEFYDANFCPKRCFYCGSTCFEDIEKGYESGYLSEFSIRCLDCGKIVGQWGWGYYNPDFILSLQEEQSQWSLK